MKKPIFLVALMALMTGGHALAQQEPVSGTSYYLYNTETGKFLTRGNSYGTQAVTNDFGSPWQVTVNNGNFILRMLDLVKAGSTSGLGDNGYSDNGSPLAFTPSGTAAGYKLSNGTNYLSSPATYGDNVLVANASGNTTWQFLNVNEYKAVLAAKTAAQEAEIARRAGLTLGESSLADVLSSAEWQLQDKTSSINGGATPSNNTWTVTYTNRKGTANNGSYGVERYEGSGGYTQTVSGLPSGIYKVGVKAMLRSVSNAACYAVGQEGYVNSSAYVSANGFLAQVKDWYSSCRSNSSPNNTSVFTEIANGGGYYTECYTYVGSDGKLDLRLVSESYWGYSWFLFGNISLTYVESLKQSLANARAQAEAKKAEAGVSEGTKLKIDAVLQATAATPATTAEYNAAITSLKDIIALADRDVNNKPAIDAMYELLNSTNIYTADAYETFKAAADDYLQKYGDGLLTEVVDNPTALHGWHSSNAYDDFLLSAWTIGGAQAKDFEQPLHINTWSTEGINDGSDFKVPFFEYWVSDSETLGANVIEATVDGLKPGALYEVSAVVRVRARNGVAATDATGITMQVGTGAAVDATEGKTVGTAQMTMADVSAYGTADADGKLVARFIVAGNTNISWLSFKDVKYNSLSDVYAQALTAAQALIQLPKEDKAQDALNEVLSEYGQVDQADADKVLEAIEALRAVIEPTQASIKLYEEIAKAIEVVKAQSTADAQALEALDAPYEAGTYHAVQDVFDGFYAIEADALVKADVADFTSVIINPSFETGDLTGWETPVVGNDTHARTTTNPLYEMSGSDGAYLFNTWQNFITTLNLTQTVKGLPAGVYTLTGVVGGYGDESPIIIKANDETVAIAPKGATADQAGIDGEVKNGYPFTVNVKVTTGSLKIYVENTGKGYTFFKADNFRLKFEPLSELALNSAGTATFAVSSGEESIDDKELDHESSEVEPAVAASEKAANQVEVDGEQIKDGVVVTYTGVDAVNTDVFVCGFRATAKVTDSQGNVFTVKSRSDEENVINVAQGLFGPNEEYEVVITPIVYYNYDATCADIYTYWENEKENHMIPDPDDASWKYDDQGNAIIEPEAIHSWILDPKWTLRAAAQEWNETVLPARILIDGTPDTDVILFEDCDPLPFYVDYNKHVFLIKTGADVQTNVKALSAQEFKAVDAWGNDFTADFLSVNSGIATGVDKVSAATGADVIYNLAGQRVSKAVKGLYIRNGKKVAVK